MNEFGTSLSKRRRVLPGTMLRCILLLFCVQGLVFGVAQAENTQSDVLGSSFNRYVQNAVASMPEGGGYSVSAKAAAKLSKEAVVWDAESERLIVNPAKAQPSFCSGGCYLVFLKALEEWAKDGEVKLSPKLWQYLDVSFGQPDGKKAWGRFNSNGPGVAKWVHDLGAGINFTDVDKAEAGDFVKIFWTKEIGKKEFGHFVVFHKLNDTPKGREIVFWASNIGEGYSYKTIPLKKAESMIFTRITLPERLELFNSLPESDSWLSDMLKKSFTEKEVREKCGITNKPAKIKK